MIIFLTKLITKVMNLLGYGATTLPGRIALFFKRDILAKLSQGVKVIVITGTNGKTTSARIVEEGLKEAGKSYFINRSGANLITGITTSFILNSTNSGKCTKEYAVIECDENAFRTVSKYLKAKVVLVTNVFRDQLDRYGEVSHTLSAIQESVNNLPEATLVINGDCSLTNTLKRENTVTYGVSVPLDQTSAVRDGTRCIHCKHQLEYDYFTYAHLGKYRCPGCGYCRETPDYNVTDIVETTPDSSTVMLNGTTPVKINLGGVYNIYNGIGALAALVSLGIYRETALHALERFSGAFGRMEKFGNVRMILIKLGDLLLFCFLAVLLQEGKGQHLAHNGKAIYQCLFCICVLNGQFVSLDGVLAVKVPSGYIAVAGAVGVKHKGQHTGLILAVPAGTNGLITGRKETNDGFLRILIRYAAVNAAADEQ